MGTRRGSEFKKLVNSYRKARKRLRLAQKQMNENKPARVVVGTAVGALAAGNPYVGGAVTAYKVGKMGHQLSESYRKTYQKTKSSEKARQATVKTATGQAKGFTRDQAISFVVDSTLPKAASETGNEMMASPLTRSFAKSALKEVLPKWE